MESKKVTVRVGDVDISFETGVLAKQANAAVLARTGDTVVLATCVMGSNPREGINYFPLLVDYEERLYAAGKIKGSRWVKREGRATDEAILTGRVIDRTLRPLFPDGIKNDVQVVTTVLCVDGENDPDMIAVTAAAAALTISDIPFDGPVAGVRVGMVDGKYVVNPTNEQREKSNLDLIVCGTKEHIIMVEAGANVVPEEEIVGGIKFAQEYLGILCKAQEDLKKLAGKEKTQPIMITLDETLKKRVGEYVTPEKIDAAIFVKSKDERDEKNTALFKETIDALRPEFVGNGMEEKEYKNQANILIDKVVKKYIQKQILEHDRRVDGRKLDETRAISCEVGVLPRTHGSALFNRGETQVLTIVTLGSKGDEQTLDGMEDPMEGRSKRYIHHYNFPGYSVGEVAPIRGPGRREIGHGALAERAVEIVLPEQDGFPYTMRLVSETLSSNGSTSMASTCGSTLALMDAGVPIKEIIGGVAMGLVLDEENPSHFKVLTDIAGIEDFNGHMDFKVTGSDRGVTALQLDIKVKGLTAEILEKAIMQAKPGRMHILDIMKAAIPAPRADLSPYAPRITSFMIKPDKIREVIGAGGKIINEIIAATGVKIDIEDSGLVMVCGTDAEMSKKAVDWIQNIVKEVQPGEEYDGKVTRLMDFGAFVEMLPGKEGLVHISELANYRVGRVEDVVKVGDSLKVKVKEIDDQGRVNLTHKPFAPKATPEQLASGGAGAGGGGRFGGDRRGGHSGGGGFHGRSGGHGPSHGGDHRSGPPRS